MNIVNIPNKVIYDLYNKEMTPLQRRCFLIFIQNAKHQLKEIKKIKKDIIKESADFPSFWEQYLNNNILFFTFSLKELKRLVKLGKRPEKELIKLLYEMKTIELNTIEKDGEIGIYKIEDILDKTTGFEEIRLGQVVPEVVITKDNVKYALSPLIVREIDSMSSYTNINLENYNTFSSPKAQRIYEVLLDKFLSQQRFKKEEEILTKWFDVSSLYKILNVRNKTPYKDFKKFYIKKAIENINKKELEFKIVSFEEHKENRRITKVRFILKANKQSKNLLQKTSNPLEIIREKVQNEEITFAEFVSSLRKLRNIQICNKLPFYKPYLV
ncbi:replication initiation protein (plasmid) [Caminibacter pacificus]|nr:replication initiation protein [Caminibacter pacificus]QDD68164.1 replication initiation protein [Caminibacter pacificus]